ncbi:MAG: cell division protein ZapB [Treponema sp.]|nr:cell division protein ZapB [Treponema sp.]
MITLDQVMLLEQKVESAVEKIQQLQAENDALRTKCQELTNALSSKTEQLSSIETDQNQIESGIKKALDRLLYIENAVLKNGSSNPDQGAQVPPLTQAPEEVVQTMAQPQQPVVQPQQTVQNTSYVQYNQPLNEPEAETEETPVMQEPNFNSMQMTDSEADEIEDAFDGSEEDDSQDNLGFDIF